MDPAPSFPCFSLVHSVTLLVQKRKTMRADCVSVFFSKSRRNWGEKRSRFCQSLGTEDRVESRDVLCLSPLQNLLAVSLDVKLEVHCIC